MDEVDSSDHTDKLLEDLNKKDERLVKALERVNGLEQENASLEDMLESLRKEQLTLVEYYEQENYSLKNKLSVHEKLALQYDISLSEELEKWKIEKSQLEDRMSRQCKADVAVVRQQLEDTTTQLHQEKLKSAQQLETITMKNERIEKLTKDLRAARTSLNETLQVEFAELSNENDNLKLTVQDNALKELELRQTMEQLTEALESAKIKEENWKYEKENMQIELSSSYEMLQSCREEQLLLREKFNASQNVGISEKGNSLFAEVDDKRISAEKKFFVLASKYRCLQQQNQQFQRHILKLKMQIATLIETRSHASDDKLIRSLDNALSSCRDENMKLMTELKRTRAKVDNMEEVKNNQFGDSSAIAKMLENEIKTKNGELAKVSEELRLSKIYSMVESRKVLDLEKQLYEKGKLLDAANSSKYRLQLEFDEFKNNLEKSDSSNTDVEPVKRLGFDYNKENESPDSCTSDGGPSEVNDVPVAKQQMPRIPLAEKAIQLDHHVASTDISKNNCSKLLSGTTTKKSDTELKDVPLTQQQMVPPSLAGKVTQVQRHEASTDVSKNNHGNMTTKETDKKESKIVQPSRRRPGFENTIETSDCKQQ